MERMIPAVSNLAVSDCDGYGYVESIEIPPIGAFNQLIVPSKPSPFEPVVLFWQVGLRLTRRPAFK